MKRFSATLRALCVLVPVTAAADPGAPTLDPVVITAARVATPDTEAPFASEVHTRDQIEASGATSLYDYLARHTSVNVLPSFGNRFTPKLDMRGYGIGDGYQNLVVTVDGRRLNNIDMMPQLIGAIPLADVERIEITKGSGAVLYGDGAMAGAIHIITRAHTGAVLAASAGNFGAYQVSAGAGLKRPGLTLSASVDDEADDGHARADVTGHKDAARDRTWRGQIEATPTEALKLALDLAGTRIDTRYPGPLTLAEFTADPKQNGGNTYNHQRLDSDRWGLGATVALAPALELAVRHAREDKRSDYLAPFAFRADYDSTDDDLGLQYRGAALDVSAGVARHDGERRDRNGWADNDTRKRNTGWYVQGQYRFAATTVALGGRRETVDYRYLPTTGGARSANHDLSAWELGVNHRLDAQTTLFANYARAFQAPDIDRFFNFGGTFNGFIRPAISRTVTLGANHVVRANRLKLALFRADVDDEIFFNPQTWTNTNLDATHKLGLEVQDTWQALDTLALRLNYAWTRARIDHAGGGAFDGKDLPGVPRHSATVAIDWQPAQAWRVNLSHVWRSRAYALDDFANAFAQRQAAFQTTDAALSYRTKAFTWFAGVDNLFARRNGLWVHDDAIYPVAFTRNWRLGLKAAF
jgi:iron complex outermembrane receptor protein